MLHFPESHHFLAAFGDDRSEAAFTRLEVRKRCLRTEPLARRIEGALQCD